MLYHSILLVLHVDCNEAQDRIVGQALAVWRFQIEHMVGPNACVEAITAPWYSCKLIKTRMFKFSLIAGSFQQLAEFCRK